MRTTIHSRSASSIRQKNEKNPFHLAGPRIADLVLFLACLVFLFVFPGDAACLEKGRSSGQVDAVISNISYEGGENYEIEITIMNRSPRRVDVRNFKKEILMQTDGGFVSLAETESAGDPPQFSLAARAEKRLNTGVKIPIGTKGLFRTFEGDVSLMFRYRLQLASERETRAGDSYYWLTPMTDRWVLREGM